MTESKHENGLPSWRIEVSRACISSGICLAMAPDNFEFVGVRARPTSASIRSSEEAELVMDAADDCPVGAISVVVE
jgi:ferredoxin